MVAYGPVQSITQQDSIDLNQINFMTTFFIIPTFALTFE